MSAFSRNFSCFSFLFIAQIMTVSAQQPTESSGPPKPKHEDTEVYEPVPKKVTPGATSAAPPSDAIILFNGKDLSSWVINKDKSPATWMVANGELTVNKKSGNIVTKQSFKCHTDTVFLSLSLKLPLAKLPFIVILTLSKASLPT